MSVMHEAEYSVGLLAIILVERMPIIGLKMKLLARAKIVPFDFHLLNDDIIAGEKSVVFLSN
jgi:hypothetical protein